MTSDANARKNFYMKFMSKTSLFYDSHSSPFLLIKLKGMFFADINISPFKITSCLIDFLISVSLNFKNQKVSTVFT